MSDASDAVAKAVTRLRQLAASRLVEKQDLESKLAALPEGDPRAQGLAAELAVADQEYRAAMAEIAELKKLARDAVGAARGISVGGDDDTEPFIRSDEEITLDNVRDHLRSLEGQVKVAEELSALEQTQEAPRPAPARPLTREERDAAARAEFEALREQRKKDADGPASPDEPPPKKPRTM